MQPRAPSGPIQKPPAGLLGFLGLKQSGDTPNTLQGFVQPQIDALPFYLANARKALFVSSAGVAGNTNGYVPFTVPPIVPEGQLWLISQGQVALGIAPGESLAFLGVAEVHNNDTSVVPIGEPTGPWGTAAAAGAGRLAIARITPGTILLPGYEIRAFVSDYVGAVGGPLELYLDYTTFPL